jgi:hypothetical protein
MLHQIFPIHYFQTSIEENEELKKMYMNAIVESYQDNHIGSPEGWTTNKMHTSFAHPTLNRLFGNFNPEELYFKYINQFMDSEWNGMIDTIWFNCYVDGDYQEQHCHMATEGLTNPHFSCIHYLSFDEKRHHPVTFMDPSFGLRCSSFEINSLNYAPMQEPNIKEGDFIMFPSYLNHLVKPSPKTEDYPRISISFNFTLTNYKGE